MAMPILILGKSGSGKSTSMRNFEPDELALINVAKKPLPFRKQFESTLATDNYDIIKQALAKTQKKSVVIDDAGYLITNFFMRKHNESNKGNGVFELYNQLADDFWNLIEWTKSKLPDDKIVYFIMHEEKNDFGDTKPKTIGKLLDEKVCVEGLFTIVLRAIASKGEYKFKTRTDGSDVTKTPMDMFETEEIDNDLKLVDTTLREYYKMPPLKEAKRSKK